VDSGSGERSLTRHLSAERRYDAMSVAELQALMKQLDDSVLVNLAAVHSRALEDRKLLQEVVAKLDK